MHAGKMPITMSEAILAANVTPCRNGLVQDMVEGQRYPVDLDPCNVANMPIILNDVLVSRFQTRQSNFVLLPTSKPDLVVM
jgi:hypothetical protein